MAEQSKTVDSALTLLTLVAGAGGSASAASLARTLGVSRTAVARLLTTLAQHGLVRRTGAGWGPGLGLLALADGIEPQLRALARTELEALAARFGETAVLSVRDGDEAVAVDQVLGDGGVVRIHYRPGTRHPLSVAASGRALLDDRHVGTGGAAAEGPDGMATAEAADGTDDAGAAADPDAAVASQGELEPGVRGVAAAVRGPDGRPIASIAVVAPIHRFPPDDQVGAAVTAAARRIGADIAAHAGAAPPPSPGGTDAVLPAGG